MNQLQVDSSSGFLEGDNRNSFKAEDKSKLLEMAQQFVDKQEYPDLNWICRQLGINVRTFWRHYDADDNFRAAYDEIDLQIENILSRALVRNGQKANGVGASAFWLKNRLSKRWSDNPSQNQIVVELSSLKKLITDDFKPVDTEIIDITSTPPKQIDNSANESDVKTR